jgi:hypothetical protein
VESFDLFRFAIWGPEFCSTGDFIVGTGWVSFAMKGRKRSWVTFPEGSLSLCSFAEHGDSDACVDFDKGTAQGCVSPSLCSTGGSICAIGRDRGRLKGDVVRTPVSVRIRVAVVCQPEGPHWGLSKGCSESNVHRWHVRFVRSWGGMGGGGYAFTAQI